MTWTVVAALFAAAASVVPVSEPGKVSIQLINPDRLTAIRVFLDRVQIYDGKPEVTPGDGRGPLPKLIATFANDGSRHVLTVEAPGTPAKAQLDWIPASMPQTWTVIRYYSGRDDPAEPGFFTFSLQNSPFLRK